MKTIYNIAAYIIVNTAALFAFLYVISLFGMYNIVDASGKTYSTMPFTTQTTAEKQAKQFCGDDCTVVRVYRK